MDNPLLSFVITGILFFGYSVIFLYLPASLISAKLKLNKLETFLVSITLGLSFYSLWLYLIRHLGLPFYIVELSILALIAGLIWSQKSKKPLLSRLNLPKPKFSQAQILFLVIALATAIVQSAVSNRSGIYLPDGSWSFTELSFHDSMQHISFIKRAYVTSDITHPGFAGAELKNYHYLIDTTLAGITRFSFVDLFHSYYRFYPIAISLIFSLSIFGFTRRLTQNEWLANLAVLFTIFAGNASYFAAYFRGEEFTWSANAFLINPIIDILQNPASIFVLAQMLVTFILVDHFTKLPKKSKLNTVFLILTIGVIAGSMIGFKAWGGLLINGGLLVMGVWDLIKRKNPVVLASFGATLVVSLVLFLPGYDSQSAASPIWIPGWSLRVLMNDADRWNNIPEIYQEEAFIFQNRPFHLIKLYTKWVLIYWLGNYWIRTIGFIAIFLLLLKHIKITAMELGIVAITGVSFIMPLLFNQGRMAYDIEQFAPYALVLSSVYTIYFFYLLKTHLRRYYSLSTFYIYLPLVFLILISWPSNLTSLNARVRADERIVSKGEVELFNFIETQTQFSDLFLIYPSHRNIATLEFAALAGRDTVYSGRTLSVITGEDFDARLEEVNQVFNNADTAKQQELLAKYGVDYVFLLSEEINQSKLNLDSFEKVFENQAGVVYQVAPLRQGFEGQASNK